MMRRLAYTLTVVSLVSGTPPACHDFCTDRCSELNGDVTIECNGCSEAFACRPGASDYGPLGVPALPAALAVSKGVPVGSSAESERKASANATWSQCKVISAMELESKTDAEIAQIMLEPQLITGLLDEWPVPTDRAGFLARFGHHKLMARRTNFAAHRDPTSFGNREDRVADMGQNGISTMVSLCSGQLKAAVRRDRLWPRRARPRRVLIPLIPQSVLPGMLLSVHCTSGRTPRERERVHGAL